MGRKPYKRYTLEEYALRTLIGSKSKTTWRKMLQDVGVNLSQIEASDPPNIEQWIDREFDNDWSDYGAMYVTGKYACVTIWTTDRVYFVDEYDGRCSVDFVQRHPGKDSK